MANPNLQTFRNYYSADLAFEFDTMLVYTARSKSELKYKIKKAGIIISSLSLPLKAVRSAKGNNTFKITHFLN